MTEHTEESSADGVRIHLQLDDSLTELCCDIATGTGVLAAGRKLCLADSGSASRRAWVLAVVPRGPRRSGSDPLFEENATRVVNSRWCFALEAPYSAKRGSLDGACGNYDNLPKQFRVVAKKLRIDAERTDLDDNLKQAVRGFAHVVDGLAPIRNKASDAHARVRKPEAHHAHLVVNAAKTLATFLVESFVVQRERGLLPPAPGSAA